MADTDKPKTETGFWGFANRHPFITLLGIGTIVGGIADVIVGKPRNPLLNVQVGTPKPASPAEQSGTAGLALGCVGASRRAKPRL